jgi:hypothetical protein
MMSEAGTRRAAGDVSTATGSRRPLPISQSGDTSGDPAIGAMAHSGMLHCIDCAIAPTECHDAAINNRSMNAPIGNRQSPNGSEPPRRLTL